MIRLVVCDENDKPSYEYWDEYELVDVWDKLDLPEGSYVSGVEQV